MKIERLKSILLVLLVISSIVLTINKWFNEKLWPEGYNFFSDVKNFFLSVGQDEDEDVFDPAEEILKPSKIIFNNSQNHFLFTKSSENYMAFYDEIRNIIELFATNDSFETVDVEEWNNTLKGKSCYFSYPVEYSSDYFFSRGSQKYAGGINYVKEFLVSEDIRIPSIMYVYAKDAESGKIFKHKIEYDSKIFNLSSERLANQLSDINYFSFELKFDETVSGNVEQPVVIDPDVLISINEKSIPSIVEQNLFADITKDIENYSTILSSFGYNSSTIRKYVESDNSIVFVENYGTLKLHSNGVLEFRSIDDTKGIALEGDNTYSCINSCISFVESITSSLPFNKNMYWQLSSDITDIKTKNFTLVFDYYINDNRIVTPTEVYNMTNSIIVDVVSGNIVSYRQLCRGYTTVNEYVSCPSAIDAIDTIEEQLYLPDNVISDIFTAYTYDSINGIWYPAWYIENSQGEIATIVL